MIGRLVMGHVGGYVTFSYGTFRYGMKSNAKFRVWDLLYRTAVYSIQSRGFFSSSCEVLTLLYTVLYEEQSRQQICQILCTIYQCILLVNVQCVISFVVSNTVMTFTMYEHLLLYTNITYVSPSGF